MLPTRKQPLKVVRKSLARLIVYCRSLTCFVFAHDKKGLRFAADCCIHPSASFRVFFLILLVFINVKLKSGKAALGRRPFVVSR